MVVAVRTEEQGSRKIPSHFRKAKTFVIKACRLLEITDVKMQMPEDGSDGQT